jgi:hypothetical protein
MEGINSYKERVFIAPESNRADIVVQMDVDNEIISLGDDDSYQDARDFCNTKYGLKTQPMERS